MAVRQYIGARYVPIFDGAWDNTKTYEPLTVVEYQGNSYTSRQAVPTGIEITNEQYWVETGNYSAQIEAYRQEVLTYNGRITQNEQDIETIKSNYWVTEPRIAQNAVSNSKIAPEAVSISKLSAALQNTIADLTSKTQKKHMVVIGDSFSTPAYSPEGDMWYTAVKRQQNLTLHNYAKSGRGYIHPATASTNFNEQINEAAADTSFNNDDVRLLIIFGGVNDIASFSGTNLYTACFNALENAISKFPNSKIIVAGMNTYNDYSRDIYLMTLQLRNACIAQGVSFIDTSWLFFGSNFISQEYNWHPNNDGQLEIAYMFNSALAGMPLVKDIYSDYDNSGGNVGTLRLYRNGFGVYAFGTMVTDSNGNCSMTFSNGISTLVYQPIMLFNQNAAKPIAFASWNYSTDTLSISNATPNTSYTVAKLLKTI